ncbi:MAG: hypothetical protein J7K15_13565, partial [Deltaproteobacteria bacterium]|nr:hypothetical protein [Deltaproteobacteria bacterium]
MAFIFQPLDRSQDLPDLIRLGFALGILNVDPRVAISQGHRFLKQPGNSIPASVAFIFSSSAYHNLC